MLQISPAIVASNEWQLDHWLKDYHISQTAFNKRKLMQLIQDVKSYYNYDVFGKVPVDKLNAFYEKNKEKYEFER